MVWKRVPQKTCEWEWSIFSEKKIMYFTGSVISLSPEGKSGANPMGSTWQSFQFNMCMRNQNRTFKNTLEDRPFLKPQKPLLYGLVGGWMGIKRVLRFCSISSMLTSKMRWFQIWPQKLSTAIRSKVMSNLLLKFWNFKADFRGGKWPKIMMVTNDLSSRRKLRKVKKKKLSKKCDFRFKNIKKPESPKMTSKSSTSS